MGTSATTKRAGTVAVGALTAAAIAAAGLGVAPAANATCASFFGIGGGANCSSTLTTIAVALGPNAEARAGGIASAALSLGKDAFSATTKGFSFGVAAGDSALAVGGDFFGLAVALGKQTGAVTQGLSQDKNGLFNIAVNVSPFNKIYYQVTSAGIGNLAVNLLGVNEIFESPPEIVAGGVTNIVTNIAGKNNNIYGTGRFLSTATNVFGKNNNVVTDTGIVNNAGNFFGSDNEVIAGRIEGSLALAASFFQKGATIVKRKPGININGFKIPKTAAATEATAPRRAAAGIRSARTASSQKATAQSAAAKR